MMGTFELPGKYALQYRYNSDTEVTYHISEPVHGNIAIKTVGPQAFAAAVAIALGGPEMASSAPVYHLADSAMPTAADIGMAFDVPTEEVDRVVKSLRWIP